MNAKTASVLAAVLATVSAYIPPLPTTVWPMPQVYNTGSSAIGVGSSFTIKCATAVCPDPISTAISRYSQIIFFAGNAAAPSGSAILGGVDLFITQDAPLALGVSENYTLYIPATSGRATVTADTQWGAMRALESFSQLVAWTSSSGNNYYNIPNAPVNITDFPRFQWRGVLMDSSRHFLPVGTIKAALDAMSYNKMNRLHWHIVDDNSWPLASVRYPNFTLGAYTPELIYTHADIQSIVAYAYERGISIVPEFDVPAHASAWGVGYPDLVISCADGQTLVDPTDTGSFYATMEGLLQEFLPLFNTDFIHFGGDEVRDFTCWQQSPAVQAFAKRQGYTTMDQVRNYLEVRLQALAANYSCNPVFWEEVYDGGYTLTPQAIVDVWLSDEELISIIKGGNRVIESYGLYLDQQTPPGDTHYFWADTFLNFYLHDPLYNQTGITPAEAARVMGLSASQWGEQVDAPNIQSRMWPRACAAAERMWSDQNLRDETAVFPRIEAQRCRMVQRGIGAGPVRPSDEVGGYCPLPSNSRFVQPHNAWSA